MYVTAAKLTDRRFLEEKSLTVVAAAAAAAAKSYLKKGAPGLEHMAAS